LVSCSHESSENERAKSTTGEEKCEGQSCTIRENTTSKASISVAREEQRSSTPAPSATQIGPFEVERLLGSGTYGTVYMARSTSGQALAVKVFKHGCPAMKRELTHHEGLTAMSSQMRRLFADIVESDVERSPSALDCL